MTISRRVGDKDASAEPARAQSPRMAHADAPRFRDLARQVGPRFTRDAFGPALAFYVGWQLGGLVEGVAAATALAIGLWWLERRNGHVGVLPRLTLAVILLQAVTGLVTGSARVYLAQPAIVGAIVGLAFLASAVIGRPLAAAVAGDLLELPESVRTTDGFVRTFRIVTVVWAVYFLARAALRLVVIVVGSIEGFLVVTAISGAPVMAALGAWSLWYTRAILVRDSASALGAESAQRVADAAEWPSD